MTALAITVGTKGPGVSARPSSSIDDDELGQPEARPAVVFGQVEAQPAELDQVVPELRQFLGLGLEQSAGGPPGVVLGQEVGRSVRQGAVVFGDRDRHGWTLPPVRAAPRSTRAVSKP